VNVDFSLKTIFGKKFAPSIIVIHDCTGI
jgi:hypothetical protein